MLYHINEGAFDLSLDGRLDRTLNLLAMPDGTGLTYIISRDDLQTGETLAQFVDRQLQQLKTQVSGFKELSRGEVALGDPKLGVKGIEIGTEFRQNGQELHQRQAIFQLPGGARALIFTASSMELPDKDGLAVWNKALASFQLRSI